MYTVDESIRKMRKSCTTKISKNCMKAAILKNFHCVKCIFQKNYICFELQKLIFASLKQNDFERHALIIWNYTVEKTEIGEGRFYGQDRIITVRNPDENTKKHQHLEEF